MQPESNPTIVKTRAERKYLSIGKAFGGDVALLPKTSELEEHYIKDFGAIPVASYGDNGRRISVCLDWH